MVATQKTPAHGHMMRNGLWSEKLILTSQDTRESV